MKTGGQEVVGGIPPDAKNATMWSRSSCLGSRGAGKGADTNDATLRLRSSCLGWYRVGIRKRPFIPGIHLGGPGAFQAIKAIQSIPGCFQSSQSNLGNTLNALAILSKAVKAI